MHIAKEKTFPWCEQEVERCDNIFDPCGTGAGDNWYHHWNKSVKTLQWTGDSKVEIEEYTMWPTKKYQSHFRSVIMIVEDQELGDWLVTT